MTELDRTAPPQLAHAGPVRLEITDLRAGYSSGRDVLHGVSMSVGTGEAVAVLGANGAGKSTLMKTIAGALRPSGGQVRYEGSVLGGESTNRRIRQGLVYVAEGHQVIGTLTVRANLALGAIRFWPGGSGKVRRETEERIFHLFPVLADKRDQLAGLMSGGQQQMLAIARSLMAQPRLLLLDEPSLGLAPVVMAQIYERLADLRSADLSMLIIEQNSERAMAFCDRTYVMRLGEIVLSTDRHDLTQDELREAYFGDHALPRQEDPAS
jgi:branched-chain amino acid transport system ATP-binding protein